YVARAPLSNRTEKTRGAGGRRPGRQDRYRLGSPDPLVCPAALSDGEGPAHGRPDVGYFRRARRRPRRIHGGDVGAARFRHHAGCGRGCGLNMTTVAFIGLGRMGHGMAGRYLDAGFAVAVWNRSKAKAEDLIARGARWASSPADAAVEADAIVTMVADDEASRAIWLGKDGVAGIFPARRSPRRCGTRMPSMQWRSPRACCLTHR